MRTQFWVVLCLLVALASAERIFLEHEKELDLPRDWKRTDLPIPADVEKEIIFALQQRNLARLEKLFWEVSDPSHEKYGQHLTNSQITALVSPSRATVSSVVNWLLENGITAFKFNKNRDFLTVTLPVSKIESLLNVKFEVFEHKSGVNYVGTLNPYSVPKKVARSIDVIAGVSGLPLLKTNSGVRRPAPLGAQATDIIPNVIRARYNVTSGLINTNPNNSHAVAEFQGQYYRPADLVEFFKKYVTVGASFDTVAKVVGVDQSSKPGIEASLDIEFIMGIAPNATTWFISVAPFPFWSDLLKWVAILSDTDGIPWVHSVSYGSQGDYPPVVYRERLDAELQKLGTRGVSIIFASGDSGAGCETEGGPDQCKLAPSYPATNIYVTCVGATAFVSGNTGPEEAVNYPGSFKSGGGFSWALGRPSYQDTAVSTYLKGATALPPPKAYNVSGRATPDVAALGSEHFMVIDDGGIVPVGGTSASSPSFAAIVTLLNQIRLDNGMSTLGFLNPWIYQIAPANPGAFFDVTIGNNIWPCCKSGDEDATTISGFNTAVGWDPVSGWGTPNFEILKTLV